jgi:hypothetical protein
MHVNPCAYEVVKTWFQNLLFRTLNLYRYTEPSISAECRGFIQR